MSEPPSPRLSGLIDDPLLIDRLGESIPGLVYVFDLLERRNVYTNRALADHLGYSPRQVSAMGDNVLANVIHPEDLPRAIEHHSSVAAVHDGDVVEIEFRVGGADGETRWLHSWETVIARDPLGRPRLLLGVAQDVTQRVSMEEALRRSEQRLMESEQRWRSIAENPFDFVVVIDRDYKFTYVNFAAPGVRTEDLLGKATPFDFVAEGDHATMRAAFEEVFSNGRAGSYDVHVPALDEWYTSLVGPIREGDQVTHASILTRNITSQKRMEMLARRAERRFRLAIEGAQDALFDRDLVTGDAFVAPRLLDLLGYAPGQAEIDVFGPSFEDFVHPDDRVRVHGAQRRTLEDSLAFRCEFRLRTARGDYRWFSGQGRVVREVGEHDHFAGFLTDVSERKAREAELERKHLELERALEVQRGLEAKLTQAAKLEAVGRLAGGIAHDFNNLLTGINGVAELIALQLSASDPIVRDINDLKQAVERGAGLTRQLLAFSRQQVVVPSVLDLNLLLGDTTRMLRRLIGENVELEFVPTPGLWPVRCDPSQISQVLLNLAVNSRDAMPNGGKLHLELANVVVDRTYCEQQPDARPGNFVRLAVSDTGTGMAAETLARVFEPFFTTKAIGHGTGLGLATVYGIVLQAEGFVHAYSELGHGTTFRIYMPMAEGAPVRVDPPSALRPGGNETILLVEDEDLVLRLTRRALMSLGYSVRVATRGDEALAQIEAGLNFDLLLTDVVLPGLDGGELYRRALGLQPDLKVVFMSGYTHNLIEEKGILSRDAHFLQKPFSLDDLATKLRLALDAAAARPG